MCKYIFIFCFSIISLIFPYNKWLLHNKWNHSDWIILLSGFLGGFITLFGVMIQIKKTEEQKEKDDMKNLLLGLKYNLDENIKEFNTLYKIVIVFSYTVRSFYDKIDEALINLDDNGVLLDLKIFNLDFSNEILRLKRQIKQYNENVIYLFNNLNKKNIILKKYKDQNENIFKVIKKIEFLSDLAIHLSHDDSLKFTEEEKKYLKEIDSSLYNSLYEKRNSSLCDDDWEINLQNSPRNLQAFFLMKSLRDLVIELFKLLKEENYQKYIEIRRDIFNFWSKENNLVEMNIYKLIEEMKILKEKVEKELEKYR